MKARFGEESNRKAVGGDTTPRCGDSGGGGEITTGSNSCGRSFGADSTPRCSDDEGKCFGADGEV